MDFELERFVKAQDDNDNYQTAIQELENGEKESHWIWFIFPQMRGLEARRCRTDMAYVHFMKPTHI